MENTIRQMAINSLRFHEQVDEARTEKLLRAIVRDRVLRKPVVVDRRTRMVLDGHHRCHVFLRLGIPTIPCYMVDYFDEAITVTFRRPEMKNRLLKEIIMRNAVQGRLFPHKTTKHRLVNRPVVNKPLPIPSKREIYSTMKGTI